MPQEPRPKSSKKTPSARPKSGAGLPLRIATWFVLAAALVILFVEWRTRSNYTATVQNLQTALGEADDDSKAAANSGLDAARLKTLIVGSPRWEQGTGAPRRDTYTWRFLLKSYAVQVEFGTQPRSGEPEVLKYNTLN